MIAGAVPVWLIGLEWKKEGVFGPDIPRTSSLADPVVVRSSDESASVLGTVPIAVNQKRAPLYYERSTVHRDATAHLAGIANGTGLMLQAGNCQQAFAVSHCLLLCFACC